MKLLLGDCLNKLKELEDNSIDSIVTDPPYGLSFMGKDWDKVKATKETQSQVVKGLGAGMKMTTLADNIEFEKWVTEWSMECMRVLKPGGYMLAFGGSRMYHRLASGVENAGFEIRDQMMWIYGSGFPKSMNISKQIDKKPNADLKKFSEALKERRIELGLSLTEADKLITGGTTMYSFLEGRKDNDVYPPNKEYWEKIKEHFGMDEWSSIVENNLKIVGEKKGSFGYQKDGERWEETRKLTETTTDLAKQWEGWGTALKPAHEPIVMARKPLTGKSVADNVIEWGTGGINIDESRIENTDTLDRFPANVIFDAEAGKLLDGQCDGVSRFFYCPKTSKKDRNEGCDKLEEKMSAHSVADKCAKCGKFLGASANVCKCEEPERIGISSKNNHPTVKPTDLMAYLIRLVTPKGGIVLDPFMGSGSTGKAAVREGMEFIGIEREAEYMEIAESRINYEISNPHKEETDKKVEVVDKLNQFFV